VVTYFGLVENVAVNYAYRGYDVPNTSGAFAFLTSFINCGAYSCKDWGWFVQGDTGTGGCTNIRLDGCWVAQPSGSEQSGSKGFWFSGVSQLQIGSIAADHIQGVGLECLSCTGFIGSYTSESCDLPSASSGVNYHVFFNSSHMLVGAIQSLTNTATIAGSADYTVVRFADSVVDITVLREGALSLTDDGSSGTRYAACCSSTGSRVRIGKWLSDVSAVLADATFPRQIWHFDGTDYNGWNAPVFASAPTSPIDGQVYYDSGTNKLRVRASGAWVDLH
jgi:hypothetical protein